MTTVKFYRKKDTEIRMVALVDENDNKKVVAAIGTVDEFLKIGLLYPNKRMNRKAWVIIERPAEPDGDETEVSLVHYDTLEEAKQAAREKYEA